jgi:glycosyltransferase involved in cell wall biosynthesis
MQIHIIGQYPPPIGGITIHIKRLISKLEKNNFDVRFFDDADLPPISILAKLKNIFKSKKYHIRSLFGDEKNYCIEHSVRLKNFKSYLVKLVFTERKEIKVVHYHTKYWKYRALLCAASKFSSKIKIVFTIHSLRDDYSKFSRIKKKYVKFALSNSDHLIVTNSKIENKLINWGAVKSKITILNPFLPPEKNQSDYNDIPNDIWQFIDSHSPIISANASKIEFYKNEDLYGLDMCIDLCTKMQSHYPNLGFIFCLPMISKEEYFEELKNKISINGITKNFLFVLKQYEFYPFLEKSDLFLRPTNTDGDALSIREALYFSVPVIASDVVNRPNGTILFKNRDIDDLSLKTTTVLDDLNHYKKMLKSIQQEDNYLKTIKLIKSLLLNNS